MVNRLKYTLFLSTIYETATSENITSNMCGQRRLWSDCANSQSDQSLRFHMKTTLYLWLSKSLSVDSDPLRKCAGSSESSLGAHVRWYVFGRFGSYHTGTRARVKLEKVSVFTYSLQTLRSRVKSRQIHKSYLTNQNKMLGNASFGSVIYMNCGWYNGVSFSATTSLGE